MFEGGGGVATLEDVAHEFKVMDLILNAEQLQREKWKLLVKAFVKRVMENACAALNGRCNMTIHFGVKDDGNVLGILVERYDIVRSSIPV